MKRRVARVDLVALVRMSSKVSIEVVLVIIVVLIFAGVLVAMVLTPSGEGFVSCPAGQCADSRGKCSVLNC
jgi:hypothetical protein